MGMGGGKWKVALPSVQLELGKQLIGHPSLNERMITWTRGGLGLAVALAIYLYLIYI